MARKNEPNARQMTDPDHFPGLDARQVADSRHTHGNNVLDLKDSGVFWKTLKEVVLEPMFILLLSACIIYFILGEYREGIIMLIAIGIVAGISLFQEYRSRNAVMALKRMSAPAATVFRDGRWQSIPTDEIVVHDILKADEGEMIAADGDLLTANDFTVNESVLTGESYPVAKSSEAHRQVYRGTLVTTGSATFRVTAVGQKTMFGKIGLSLQQIQVEKTPLQLQIRAFVRNMVWLGALAFAVVVGIHYYESGELIHALLHGLTLAMSVVPEEIPVAFSTFQALGAFRLLRHQIIVKHPQYVETLGSATVICADKTGTLTENKMQLAFVYDATADQSIEVKPEVRLPEALLSYAMWASERQPFDPMERALHEWYAARIGTDQRELFRQVHEYPMSGQPPMMTHVFSDNAGNIIIAAKGAPEAILKHSKPGDAIAAQVIKQAHAYARMGLRVLGVGKGSWPGKDFPQAQEDFGFELLGLVAFHDPPKANMAQTVATFHQAGIQVKMITGDYAETALAIAGQIGLDGSASVLTGNEVLSLSEDVLRQKARETHVFARMFPEAKMKVITALKDAGEVVAMTGDGVNDGPALKAAHIGIAMGSRGSEVAKSAAALILTDDDLAHMTDAVALGRKIYDNLRKAIRYIVSIHIPIILIVTLPVVLFWRFNNIFSPVHVIFLELIMGPTCSIIYENEPMEPNTMNRPPRPMTQTFLSGRQLLLSIVQGLAITAACLLTAYYYMQAGYSDAVVRTLVFAMLLFSNIFLTLVNRSFYYSVVQTLRYRNNLVPWIAAITLALLAMALYVPFVQELFQTTALSLPQLSLCMLGALAATFWLEGWKWVQRRKG